MILELMSDLFNDMSPFYMYVGVLWSVIGAIRLINMDMGHFTKQHRFYVRHTYHLQNKKALMKEPLVMSMDMLTWLVHKMKQREVPDEDNDEPSSNFFIPKQKIRGGINWKFILYSHPLKNIVS